MFRKPLLLAAALLFIASPLPARAADAPPPPLNISGDVVDADGKPLPNATVIIPSDSDTAKRGTLAATRTDSAGKFSFENIDTTKAESDLIAIVPGVGVSQPARLTALPIHLQLVPSYDVQITVLKDDGTPAQDVEMHITFILFPKDDNPWGSSIFLSEEKQQAITAVTDAWGKCIFHGMPRNATLRFDTDDLRFARLWYGGQTPLQGDGPLVVAKPLRLTKAASISGRLVTQTGQPEAGRIVSANGEGSLHDSLGQAVTDAEGRYTMNQLKQGLYVVSLRNRKDGPTEWVAPLATVTATTEKPATLDFTLTHGALIKGQGRDTLTGKPLEGLDIGNYADTPYQAAVTYYGRFTDKEGNYEFRVPPGTHYPYMMGQVPDGYLQPAGQAKKTVTVEEGQTVEVNFDIQPDPAPIIEGTVVDPTGKPVPDAWVTIQNPKDHEALFSRQAKSDAEGHVHFHAQPGYVVRAGAKDLSTKAPIPVLDERPMEIKLAKENKFMLLVQLTDQEGRPATNATAILVTDGGVFGNSSTPERKPDAQGTVRFGPLPTDGKYTVLANGADYGAAYASVNMTDLPPDAKELAVPISLQPATAEIAGIVVDEFGKPLPDVAVTINGGYAGMAATGQKETQTDANGHFSFHVVEGASAEIYPHRDGGYSGSPPARVKAGQTDLNLMLPKAAP